VERAMKQLTAAVCVLLLVLAGLVAVAADQPKLPTMPAPVKEHAWLQQLVGEWETEATMTEPGQPPQVCKGSETVRALGGFWIVAESKMDVGGQTMNGVLTLGYDPEKKSFVGTWVDSMTSNLWKYDGSVDEGGKVLTLNTRGPCPMMGGKMTTFKERMELTDKDHRVFTSSFQGEDGTWSTMVTVRSTRRK
jgi:hypothetical protein